QDAPRVGEDHLDGGHPARHGQLGRPAGGILGTQPAPPNSSGPTVHSTPASGTPANAHASSDAARRSSGSRLWTVFLPTDFATPVSSIIIACRKFATRSAPASGSSRASSSGSCVVMPTGQRPVWQWWQAPGAVPSFAESASYWIELPPSASSPDGPIATASAPRARHFAI